MAFHGSRWVFHGSRWIHGFSGFQVFFHGFRSIFYGFTRLLVGFSWFQVGFYSFSRFQVGFHGWEHPKRYPLDLYLGPTILLGLLWPSDNNGGVDDDAAADEHGWTLGHLGRMMARPQWQQIPLPFHTSPNPEMKINLSVIIIARPKPAWSKVDRRALLQLRWVYLWVFSVSRFTPLAPGSEGGGDQACGF